MATSREPGLALSLQAWRAHSFLPLESPLSAAFGLVLGITAHAVGWPIPQGGAQSIADALVACLEKAGGTVTTNAPVLSLRELGDADLTLLDVTPRQLLSIGGEEIQPTYRRQLERYRYGPGVFKVDWALSQPIPWRARECLRAGTVHLGGTFEEIAASEREPGRGTMSDRPFVLLSQPTLFDPSRAPAGKHVAWAYCHVPNGWSGSALEAIEAQVERFAPGFRECILGRAVFSPEAMKPVECKPGGRRHQRRLCFRLAILSAANLAAVCHSDERGLPVLIVHTPGRRGARHVRLLGSPMRAQSTQLTPPGHSISKKCDQTL